MKNFVKFENMSKAKTLNLTIEWDTLTGTTFTEIKPEEIAEIVFDDNTAIFCHRSDGGVHNTCPITSYLAKAGDYYRLYENGKTETVNNILIAPLSIKILTYRSDHIEPSSYSRFVNNGVVIGSGFDPANLTSNKGRAIDYEEEWLTKGAKSKSEILYISNYESFTKAIKIDTSLSASYLKASVSSESSKSISESFSETNINILIQAYADYGWFGMKAGAKLTDDAIAVLQNNQQEFIKRYGSRFIDKEQRMNSISILLTIRNVSKKFKSTISSTLSASGGYAGASASIKQTINEEITRENNSDRIELSAFTIGGEGIAGLKDVILPNLKNNNNAIEYINELITTNLATLTKDNAIPYDCSVADMRIFGLTETAKIPWDFSRMQSMEKLKTMYLQLSQHLEIYDKIKNRITPFYELFGGESIRSLYVYKLIGPRITIFEDSLLDIARRHEFCKTNIDESSFDIPNYQTNLFGDLKELVPQDYIMMGLYYDPTIENGKLQQLDDVILDKIMSTIPKDRENALLEWITPSERFNVNFQPRTRKTKVLTITDSLKYKHSYPYCEGVKKTKIYEGPGGVFTLWANSPLDSKTLEQSILEYIPTVHCPFKFQPFVPNVIKVEYEYSLYYTVIDMANREFTYKLLDLEMDVFHYYDGTQSSNTRLISYYL